MYAYIHIYALLTYIYIYIITAYIYTHKITHIYSENLEFRQNNSRHHLVSMHVCMYAYVCKPACMLHVCVCVHIGV